MNKSFKLWNTFGINRYARNIVCVNSVIQLLNVWKSAVNNHQSVVILGEGSNVLFLDDFHGTVIINRIMGIKVTEDNDAWNLHVKSGENWHKLVKFTIKNNMPGLENLALIPGCVGASPIHNIGAYGIEFNKICQYVDCIELKTGIFHRLQVEECHFGYRDSIFKHEYKNTFFITAIGIRLFKRWKPLLTYGDLINLNPITVTPEQIFNRICYIRMKKLPDPKVNGNAGSFFKNPIISSKIAKILLMQWPHIPHYLQDNGYVKLSAGWLIEQCKLKGVSSGGAAVHRKQALVLINKKDATGMDFVSLARMIRKRVGEKFNVWLEPEVRFIGIKGEVNAVEIIT